MPVKVASLLLTGLLVSVSGMSQSESMFRIGSTEIEGVTLFDQELKSEGLVAIKPTLLESKETDVSDGSIDLSRCLWSVHVNFDTQPTDFTPGKMICVGPNQEVLEALPAATIEPFGACADSACGSYLVKGNTQVGITLNEPIELTLQPRNERK